VGNRPLGRALAFRLGENYTESMITPAVLVMGGKKVEPTEVERGDKDGSLVHAASSGAEAFNALLSPPLDLLVRDHFAHTAHVRGFFASISGACVAR